MADGAAGELGAGEGTIERGYGSVLFWVEINICGVSPLLESTKAAFQKCTKLNAFFGAVKDGRGRKIGGNVTV